MSTRHILLTGGTGTIGKKLVPYLIANNQNVSILSRQTQKPETLSDKIEFITWDIKCNNHLIDIVENTDAIINLAGAGLGDQRWGKKRKKEIINSRLNVGRTLVNAIKSAKRRPEVLVQASAIGYYGTHLNETFTESSNAGTDFLADFGKDWENITKPIEKMGVRRVIIRSGVVFDDEGGALPKMLFPFKFFIGGKVGSGNQWISWIHYQDEIEAIHFLIKETKLKGPFNLTAPNPIQNKDLAKVIGRILKRPSLFPVPAFVMKLLFGEMSSIILKGQQVIPEKLIKSGFIFKFPAIDIALKNIIV